MLTCCRGLVRVAIQLKDMTPSCHRLDDFLEEEGRDKALCLYYSELLWGPDRLSVACAPPSNLDLLGIERHKAGTKSSKLKA